MNGFEASSPIFPSKLIPSSSSSSSVSSTVVDGIVDVVVDGGVVAGGRDGLPGGNLPLLYVKVDGSSPSVSLNSCWSRCWDLGGVGGGVAGVDGLVGLVGFFRGKPIKNFNKMKF